MFDCSEKMSTVTLLRKNLVNIHDADAAAEKVWVSGPDSLRWSVKLVVK